MIFSDFNETRDETYWQAKDDFVKKVLGFSAHTSLITQPTDLYLKELINFFP